MFLLTLLHINMTTKSALTSSAAPSTYTTPSSYATKIDAWNSPSEGITTIVIGSKADC